MGSAAERRWRPLRRPPSAGVPAARSREAFGLARLEITFALLRAAGAALAVAGLLTKRPVSDAGLPVPITGPIWANAGVLCFTVAVALVARTTTSADRLRRLGRVVIAFDLLFFAAYSA